MDIWLKLQDGKYISYSGKLETEYGIYKIDASKTPKQVNIDPEQGVNKGKKIAAIYKLDGDTLTICYDFDERRPLEFRTKEGDHRLLAVFKRDK